MDIAAAVALGLVAWFASYTLQGFKDVDTRMDNFESRLSMREGNAYTSQQAGTDLKDIWKEIAELKRQVALLPQAAPPAWFEQRVNKLEVRVEEMYRILVENNKTLKALQ